MFLLKRIPTGAQVRGDYGEYLQWLSAKKPIVSVSIKHKDGSWNNLDVLLDTGADCISLNSQDAENMGLDIDGGGSAEMRGIDEFCIKGILKKDVRIKIGVFPPIPVPVFISPFLPSGRAILGRSAIFPHFGIAMTGGEIGIFTF